MAEKNIPQLQAEIARLNQIIIVLLEQNEHLKADNSLLEEKINSYNSFHSPSEQSEKTNFDTHRNILQEQGINEVTHSTSGQQTGINTETHSLNTQTEGMKQETQLHDAQAQGMKQATHSTSLQTIPANEAFQPNSSATIPSKQENALLPEKIEVTEQLVSLLSSKLIEQKIIKSGSGTPQAAAKLLLHFHNGGSGLYTELLKLTGYSQGGLAKLLMSMRKKSLLVRASFQHYVLSEKAKTILSQAMNL